MLNNILSRRNILTSAAGIGLLANGLAACKKIKPVDPDQDSLQPNQAAQDITARIVALEKSSGGRLGVAILNTANGAITGHRMDERFAMCSTFKLPLAAVILREADNGRIDLNKVMKYSKSDLMPNSPITTDNVAKGGMSVVTLAEATQTTSDNTAANLLLQLFGGPAGFEDKLREAGDKVTRIDRTEPEMNRVFVGDEHDTTQPAAMARTLQHMLTTDYLMPATRERLIGWMVATKTGVRRLRAGLPTAWRAGNKTGTGEGNNPDMPARYNDVAIVWPTGKAPIIITSYYESAVHSEDMRDEDQAVLAKVAQIAASWVTG